MLLAGARAHAQTAPLTPEARREAAERFDRGLRLFNQGENAGALVEFKRTYELTGDPTTLFNIGLVYAELKRPVDAVDALDTLLKSAAKLGPEQRKKAEQVRAEQWTFVAFLEIGSNVPAAIEIDDLEAGRTPQSGTLRVAAGHHVVGVVASGYAPSRKTVDIAGGETQKLAFDLVPGEAALGHLAVRCSLPAAEVWVDGKQQGRTPLAATLALDPGPHHIEVRRDGYRAAVADLKLDLGAVAEVTLDPEIDAAEIALTGGNLAVTASEQDATLSVDGRPPVPLAGSIRLPVGPHHVTVTRAGFETGGSRRDDRARHHLRHDGEPAGDGRHPRRLPLAHPRSARLGLVDHGSRGRRPGHRRRPVRHRPQRAQQRERQLRRRQHGVRPPQRAALRPGDCHQRHPTDVHGPPRQRQPARHGRQQPTDGELHRRRSRRRGGDRGRPSCC